MDEGQINELQHKVVLYRQMIGIYPNEPKYQRRLIELLLQLGEEQQALEGMQQLERLYRKLDQKEDLKELKKIRHSLTQTENLHSTLNPFLSSISPAAVNMLMQSAKKIELNDGDMLIRQGDTDDGVFIVLDGELAVMAHYPKQSKPVLIRILKEGEVVGEIAFLEGGARTSSVVANTNATVLKLSPKKVLQCMLEYPEIADSLRQGSEFKRNLIAIHSNPLMASLTDEDKKVIAQDSAIVHYAPFTVVSRLHENLEWVGIMVSGLVRMVLEDHKGNSHLLDPIKPGELIGEMTALQGDPVMADMVAINETLIMQIPAQTFREIMDGNPIVKKRIIDLSFKQIASTMTYINQTKT